MPRHSTAALRISRDHHRAETLPRFPGPKRTEPSLALGTQYVQRWLQRITPAGLNDNRLDAGGRHSPGVLYRYRGSFEHGRVERIGPEVEQILGYSPAEVQALPVENMLLPWLSPHPNHGSDYVEYLKQAFVPGRAMTAINRATTKSGQVRWILLSAQPVEDHGDGTFSLEGIILDVTDQVEQQTLGGQDHLQAASVEKQNALMRMMRTFIHDIANVLAAARMFADLVVSETEDGSQANRHAGRIAEACDEGAEKIKSASVRLRAEQREILEER